MIIMGTFTASPTCQDIARQHCAADAHAPHDARLHVRARLGTWRLQHLSETLELLASELVTNAIRYSGGSDVMLWLTQTDTSVVVHVADANPRPPVPCETGELDETGRGLAIVTAISDRTGYYPFRSGKVVYCEVTK